MADKTDVVKECQRQLFDIKIYIKLSLEEMEILISKIKSELSEIVGKYKSNNLCSTKEKDFCWVKWPILMFHIFILSGKFSNPIRDVLRFPQMQFVEKFVDF